MSTPFDKRVAEPDVIDNREVVMADVLNLNLKRIDSLDVSSGYFDVNGFGLVQKALAEAAGRDPFSFRLLLGEDAIKSPSFETFEEYRRAWSDTKEPSPLSLSLGELRLDAPSMDYVSSLIALLRQENVQVRRSAQRFNHAKCYILGQEGAIVGSSNFTQAGLTRNDELNTGVYNTATWEKIRAWYERLWERAQDAKADMLQVLEQSKFGVPPNPYEIYLKMLFEKYKMALMAMAEKDVATTKSLAKFQRDAATTLLQIISEYGGAVLADSTGLGKTHIGLEVIRRKMLTEDRRTLLVAPAQVRDTVWIAKLKEARIQVDMVGMEELGRKDFRVDRYKRCDFVVIDESQNFRSGTANRRHNLMKIISLGKRKQVLLLSATPINNSIMDLYYQLSIITGGRDYYFRSIGIPDLYRYLRKAANHKLHTGLEKIQQLLDAVMVRRTRTFIKEAYPQGELDGRPIKFPQREYKPIRYGITELFGDVYDDLLTTINSLSMVPYGIERYNRKSTESDRKKHRVLAHLQVILLLKRFESSAKAVSVSIDNKIALFKYFGTILRRGKIISPRHLGRIMIQWNMQSMDGDSLDDDEARDEFFMREVEKLPIQDAADYDTRQMIRDIDSDLEHLSRYKRELERILPVDKKIDAVVEMILRDRALEQESNKVLIFTEYTATATYIRDKLKAKFPDKRVLLITGGVKKRTRQEIIKAFAPNSNLEEGEEAPEKADILVSTEVLAEGQNLQDCNYVINYDLPWNPMRIVQRIGRIDRLTSKFDIVRSRECFPDKELDKLLHLVGSLMSKISDINDTVGLDADLLGQEATPKQFNNTTVQQIRAFAGGDDVDRVAGDLERESDLMPAHSPINEINQYIRHAGIAQMEEFPMGRRSGKRGEGQKAILGYLQERPRRKFYSVLFDYATRKAKVIDDMEAINLARCSEETPTHLPMDDSSHRSSFEQLLQIDAAARDAIELRNRSDLRVADELRVKNRKQYEQIIDQIKEIVIGTVLKGEITMEDGGRAVAILESADLHAWKKDVELLLEDYKSSLDAGRLVSRLKQMGESIGVEEAPRNDDISEEAGELVLVGAVFITGDELKLGLDEFS